MSDDVSVIATNVTNFTYTDSFTVTTTDNYEYYTEPELYTLPWNQLTNQITDQQFITLLDNSKYRLTNTGELTTNMPDSERLKTIYAMLGGEEWKDYTKNVAKNTATVNIWDKVNRGFETLGILENPDKSIRSIRQKRAIKAGSVIPSGWNFGQWGRNKGGNQLGQLGGDPSEDRNGIVYEVRSRKYIFDKLNPDKTLVEPGDLILCETLWQYWDEQLDDLNKALGWEELGALPIPSADGSGKMVKYEGLASLLADSVFMLSKVSQHTSQALISSLITQAVVYEILASKGQPITHKTFPLHITGEKPTQIIYPGLRADAPSDMRQTEWILRAIAPITAVMTKE